MTNHLVRPIMKMHAVFVRAIIQVVLDGLNKTEMINMETENLQCSMDINRLEIKEIDQLSKFIENARQQVQGNGKKVE